MTVPLCSVIMLVTVNIISVHASVTILCVIMLIVQGGFFMSAIFPMSLCECKYVSVIMLNAIMLTFIILSFPCWVYLL